MPTQVDVADAGQEEAGDGVLEEGRGESVERKSIRFRFARTQHSTAHTHTTHLVADDGQQGAFGRRAGGGLHEGAARVWVWKPVRSIDGMQESL